MKFFILCVCLLTHLPTYALGKAQQLFGEYKTALFQIKTIDNTSGEKVSIGTGFAVSDTGLIATNYHVIANAAQWPKKNTLRYKDSNEDEGSLTLLKVDVVNDLAIVKYTPSKPQPFFKMSEITPNQGQQLFSLGNPHDLGMIVVPGTYNGIKEDSFIEKIHFTGSINSGMSGGPVVNKQGQVIGINVATSGNQIGFLVPHTKLVSLLDTQNKKVPSLINEQIKQSLVTYQRKLLKQLLETPWATKHIASAKVPTELAPYIRCWGDSNSENKESLVHSATSSCRLEENIYLSKNLTTGTLYMSFEVLNGEKISSQHFYNLYQQWLEGARGDNKARRNDVTNYVCQQNKVALTHSTSQIYATSCVRAYKKYPGLFDIIYISGTIDKANQGLISHYTLAGVEQALAQAFNKKFMEAATWQ